MLETLEPPVPVEEMPRFDYNLVAIGGGAAGLVTSLVGSTIRARVALIEKDRMGGDCLNTGCVPSKALIACAKRVHQLHGATALGLQTSGKVDFAAVTRHVRQAIEQIAPNDSVERFTSLGVECFTGEARVCSPQEVEVHGRRLTTRKVVIATGARPQVPPIPGLSEVSFSHSENLWEWKELPQRLAVIGGGPIGCELAQAFSRLGSQVQIIHDAHHLLPREDEDVTEAIRERFQTEGITVHSGVRIERVERHSGGTRIHLSSGDEGSTQQVEVDHLLIAAGRQANTEGFGLEELGVELNPEGTIRVDDFLQTSVPHLYACGDVAGPYQFTHMAGHQAWYAAVNALFSPWKRFAADYSVVPWCTYTDPEVARVGLNEQEARLQGVPYEVTSWGFEHLDRAITDGEASGMLKILTVPGKDRLLGVSICGPHAGELLAEYVLAMKHGLGLNAILRTIHAYPTFAESSKLAAGVWRKQRVPSGLLKALGLFHRWQRR